MNNNKNKTENKPKNNYYFESLKELNIQTKRTAPWEILDDLKEIKIENSVNVEEWKKKNVTIIGEVEIHPTAKIMPYTVIEGPTIIHENALIRPHVWIRGSSIIGKNTVIGKGTEFKNSILSNNAKIGTNCFVGDSILGKGARIGSGSIISNRRFDQKEIGVKIDNNLIMTGKDKFGGIIGDYSRITASCTLSPGTAIGQHSWIIAKNIHGFIESNKLVKEENASLVFKKKEKTILKDTDNSGKR